MEKYKEKLEEAKKLYESANNDQKHVLESLFPELKESEDEKIRKEIIKFLESPHPQFVGKRHQEEWIAWLEKQVSIDKEKVLIGARKNVALSIMDFLDRNTLGMCLSNMECADLEDAVVDSDWLKVYNYMKKKLEKQSDNLVKNGYTNNKDYIRYANKYSHEIWHKLMDNFKNIKDYHIGCNDVSDIVLNAIIDTFNWLEKGGDKNKVSKHVEAINEEKVDNANKVEPEDYNSIDPHFGKPADKIEPKFHEGEWVIFNENNNSAYQVEKIDNYRYYLRHYLGGTLSVPFESELIRKWTVKDAKAGDVVVYKKKIKYSAGIKYERICLFNNLNNAFFTLTKTFYGMEDYSIDVNIDYPDNTVPATKEQKEILFKTMANAGYTFDFKKKELKKIEQVHAKWSEEVEPKFKVGYWVVNNTTLNSCHILKVEHGQYICDDCSFPIAKENEYHLWTIKDAKDGDLLTVTMCPEGTWIGIFKEQNDRTFSSHCFVNTLGIFKEGTDNHGNGTAIHPATKEQRNFLFQKMKEAGYKWDAEKKELKKIKFNPDDLIEESYQQQSELYEKLRKWIIGVLTTYEYDRDLRDPAINWLKSLKQKNKKIKL